MECVDSFWNSGEPAYGRNCLDADTGINRKPILKDSFQCTFFRQPKRKLVGKHGTWQLFSEKPTSSSLSDICTDSESEVDEVVSLAQLPRTTTMCDGQSYDQAGRKSKVTFGATPCFNEDGYGSTGGKNNGTSGKATVLYGRSDKIPSCSPTCEELYPEDFKSNKLMRALSGVKNVLRGTKRSHDPANSAETASGADSTLKKKKPVESRIDRNKRLLKTMEDVIRTMNEEEVPFEVALESVESIEPDNKLAEINIALMMDREERGQSSKEITDDETAEQSDIRESSYIKPELETLLDESMQRAVKKYRTGGHTWKKLKEEMSQDPSETNKLPSEDRLQNYFTSKLDLKL